MATNFVAPGDTVTITAPSGGVTVGIPVVLGQIFGVPAYSAASGVEAEIVTGGIWDLPKTNAASMSMAVGANVHWDATNSKCTVSATSNAKLGVVVVAASNTDATVRVRLNKSF